LSRPVLESVLALCCRSVTSEARCRLATRIRISGESHGPCRMTIAENAPKSRV